ncbi:putative GST superfamily protein [Lyophyllum shimeji]|uniref:glutathione transferase n=1 Tax=Lyophyllum shimeji TaxID=47721 RepID=A0A9P3PSF4_LYOSH|nr:putative GST superfamily protein [Lyophyllum shimeji]
MVFKVYGNRDYAASKRVATVLLEKHVPFELIEVDSASGEHKSPAFLEKQPFGQTPYIDDDGFILYESRAICRYIATAYAYQGTSLIPTDPQENALFEQAASIELTNFDPPALAAIFEGFYRPVVHGEATDTLALTEHMKKLGSKLDVYDVILGKQRYLAGEEVTLADLFHLPNGELLLDIGCNFLSARPNVARWWKDISTRLSWLSVKDGINSTT